MTHLPVFAGFSSSERPFLITRLLRWGPFQCWLTLLLAGISGLSWGQCFEKATNFPLDGSPGSVVVGDFNGDGKPDLATTDGKVGGVSVLLNNGRGGFLTATRFNTAGVPRMGVVGDVNTDGKPDLVLTIPEAKAVAVLLGDGRGGFGAPASFSLTGTPLSVETGDFNGDGLPDLVTANGNDNTVSILLNTGSGRFGPATNFRAQESPISIAVADFNGDGKLDLAVATVAFSSVSLLLGDGAGGFVGGAVYYVASYPLSVVTGDFNGDGKPDLATASTYFQENGWVSVLLNDGNKGFGKVAGFRVGTTPQSLVVTDMNGDSKPDLATVNYISRDVSVLTGDGQGTFSQATAIKVAGNPQAIAVGDFNGDGRPDLATANKDLTTANNTNGTVSVLLNCTAQEADALTISPNPTTDVIQVSLTDTYRGIAVVTLVDAAGKVLQTYSFPGIGTNRQHTLSMRGLPPGVYYLTVQQGEQRMTEKVLKY